jgi:hypothetical protein
MEEIPRHRLLRQQSVPEQDSTSPSFGDAIIVILRVLLVVLGVLFGAFLGAIGAGAGAVVLGFAVPPAGIVLLILLGLTQGGLVAVIAVAGALVGAFMAMKLLQDKFG